MSIDTFEQAVRLCGGGGEVEKMDSTWPFLESENSSNNPQIFNSTEPH